MTPLSDVAAELLGVEKRKYLVYGNSLYDLMLSNGKNKFAGYNNVVYNFRTIKCVSTKNRDFKKVVVNGIDLFEGKLVVERTLPIKKPADDIDIYPELFDGEIKWAP